MTRWGILSTANINRKVLAGTADSPEVEFVAVASRDVGRARAWAAERGIPHAYGSYEELLADPQVEAVYLPLPNALHVPWSIRALAAGKHVLCEKPLSRREADVRELFDAAARAGLLCMEGYMWRHNPQTRRLAALVADGAVGRPRLIRAAFRFALSDLDNVRLSSELDGGALMDVGCYGVSALRLLAGEPLSVTAQQVTACTGSGVQSGVESGVESGVDVRLAATLSFAEGVLGIVDCALDAPAASELEVIGSEGTIRVDDPWHCRTPGLHLRRGDRSETIAMGPVDSYRMQFENFGAAVRGEARPLLGRSDALGQARTIEALYQSATTGTTINL